MDIPSITLDFTHAAITIPAWSIVSIPLVLGMVCMWMSGRNERRGIQAVTATGLPHQELRSSADRRFRNMGIWRVLAYGSALAFLALV